MPVATDGLAQALGPDALLSGDRIPSFYGSDETETQGVHGQPDVVALPSSTDEVISVMRWCYEHGVPLVSRGGGTGFSGGAVPIDGGLVLSLERMNSVRAFDPGLWRIHVEAGMITSDLKRRCRENGLFFPPDPGAAETSQIGGNVATNAGGPHAFKYGVTGNWVTGIEAVVPPGEPITVGGPIRKDVAGYDIKSLLIGSEGTLGVITAVWLRLLPTPEVFLPVVGFYDGVESGCEAIGAVLESGLAAATLEYLDERTLEAAGGSFPGGIPDRAGFMVIAEADGSEQEATRLRAELVEALEPGSLHLDDPAPGRATEELWRWRDGVSIAVTAQRGGKVSEDIVVPMDRLAEAITETLAIGDRHDLDTASWGHAGDGNLHSTFLISPGGDEVDRAGIAMVELFELAARLGGSISGEHGVGWVKRGQLGRQWSPRAVELHGAIKRCFDPENLLNPGKKT
jgi:glycolate oxidase subunit GlcD